MTGNRRVAPRRETPVPGWRRGALAVAGLAVVAVPVAPAAAAAPADRARPVVVAPAAYRPAAPPTALAGPLTDTAGVLSTAEEASVKASLEQLAADKNITLYVVLVKSFSGTDSREWAKSTFTQSGMGDQNAVLAIATGDNAFAIAVGSRFPIDEDTRAQINSKEMVPLLRQRKWADAVVALAEGYRHANESGDSVAPSLSTGGGLLGAGGVALLGLGVGTAVIMSRRRKAASNGGPVDAGRPAPAPVNLEELDKQASRELVTTDEAVRNAERELGFAQAEFGDQALAPYVSALTAAKASLTRAFSLRQQLDDAIPETPEQRGQLLSDILGRCAETKRTLADQADDFNRLRDLGRRAGEILPQLRQRVTTLQGDVPRIAATIAGLTTRYSAQAVQGVAGVEAQIAERLGIARVQLDQATGMKGTEAAVPLHTAEEAISQVDQLVKRVDGLAAELTSATGQLGQAAAALQADVAAVSQADEAMQSSIGPALAAARAALGYTQTNGSTDPVGALKRVVEADAALDKALATAQEDVDRSRRALDRLPRALETARRDVQDAEDIISTNRGAVGSTARTRVAEARRILAEAEGLAQTDPVAALDAAGRASQLAAAASAEAERDRDSYGGGWGGGRRHVGLDPISVIIGSTMGGWGGGHHGGGWGGGGSWGGGGGDIGGGFSGGGPFSGSGDAGRF